MKNPERVAELLAELRALSETDFERHRIDVLERDLTAPPTVEVLDDKHQKFLGFLYRAEPKGHFVRNQFVHRDVWQYYHGDIPEGDYEIHHIDHNKANNDIANLQLLTRTEHGRLHTEHLRNPDIQCSVCGKIFHPRSSTQKYCSLKCAHNAMVLPEKACLFCGKMFRPKKSPQKYCSNQCSAQAREVRRKQKKACEEKTCPVCGGKFYSSRAKIYCSAVCRNKAALIRIRRPQRKITCAVCGKEILASSSNRKYCSECKKVISRRRKKEIYSPSRAVEKSCIICGKKFSTQFPHQICCSPECAGIRKAQKDRGTRRKDHTPISSLEKTCVICGKMFAPKKPRQICCSRDCAQKRNNQLRKAHFQKQASFNF